MPIEAYQFSHEVEDQGPMRVLWVDDQGVSPEDLALFGGAANADVTVATTVEEAVAEWQRGDYNALVLDHRIGEMRYGYEVLDRVRGSANTSSRLSVVAVVTWSITPTEMRQYWWVGGESQSYFLINQATTWLQELP